MDHYKLRRFESRLLTFFTELCDASAIASQIRPEPRRVLIDDPNHLAKTGFTKGELALRLRVLVTLHPDLFGQNNHHVIVDLNEIWRCAVALNGNSIRVRLVYKKPKEDDELATAWEKQLSSHLAILDHPDRTADLYNIGQFSPMVLENFERQVEHRLVGLGDFCKVYACPGKCWERYLDIYRYFLKNVIKASSSRQRSMSTEITLDSMHRLLLTYTAESWSGTERNRVIHSVG